MRFRTLESARDTLDRLRSDEIFTIDDLFDLSTARDFKWEEILQREHLVISALQPPRLFERALDFSDWILGIAGFSGFVADYYAEGALGIWGWVGLLVVWISLVRAAVAYTRREWTLDGCAAELQEICQWKDVLAEIEDEIERRLTLV